MRLLFCAMRYFVFPMFQGSITMLQLPIKWHRQMARYTFLKHKLAIYYIGTLNSGPQNSVPNIKQGPADSQNFEESELWRYGHEVAGFKCSMLYTGPDLRVSFNTNVNLAAEESDFSTPQHQGQWNYTWDLRSSSFSLNSIRVHAILQWTRRCEAVKISCIKMKQFTRDHRCLLNESFWTS